jgi:uncharacterized repeat protein (TIGR03803 family)
MRRDSMSVIKAHLWRRVYARLLLFCAAMTTSASAQVTFTRLYNFSGPDGAGPASTLVQGLDGSFYGTTAIGGAYNQGSVFKTTVDGTLTTLYSFCSQTNCPDGEFPAGALLLGSDGNFYGTTPSGGLPLLDSGGTIFRITPTGTLTTLFSFPGPDYVNGMAPNGGLAAGTDNYLYGTTNRGGANGSGTVFKITVNGELTTLYSFCSLTNCADGAYPTAGVVVGNDGNFYGTTFGSGIFGPYPGTVFKITPQGALTTLHTFCQQSMCGDGAFPDAALTPAPDGDFYGTTSYAGPLSGRVFKITRSGALIFSSTIAGVPTSQLLLTANRLFGTTQGGPGNTGTVFTMNAARTLTTLHSFNYTDGESPVGLVQGTNGIFYGTTAEGGTYSEGTIFSVSVGLGPLIDLVRNWGKVGQSVDILGQGFV